MVRGVAVCVTSLCGTVAACGSPAETDFNSPVGRIPGVSTGGAGSGGAPQGGGGAGGSAASSGGTGLGGDGGGGRGGVAGTGSGGSSAGGGSGGSGGSGGVAPGPDELVDDMEDGDGQVLLAGGRDGYWYTFGDDTGGYLEPAEGVDFVMGYVDPPRPGSVRAARLLGGNFEDWGAALAFDFDAEFAPYDASSFTGLRFFARSAQGDTQLAVALPDRHSTPQAGVCDQGGPGPNIPCFDHPLTNVAITQDWAEYTVRFDALDRAPTSLPPFDATAVYSVHFGTPAGGTFDVWIDDVAFTR
jgi:hypothetical protein